MLVRCPCGKKLKLKDSLAGKKVRCPACEEVFVAEEEAAEEEAIITQPKKKRAIEEEEAPRKKKRKPVPEDEDEEDEETESPRKKGKKDSSQKKGVSLVRYIVSSVLLVGLVVVAAVVFWIKLAKPGTVTVKFTPPSAEVFLDGKKVEHSGDTVEVSIDGVRPGNHEIKVTAAGYQPFTKQVTVKSDETESFRAFLMPEKAPGGPGRR